MRSISKKCRVCWKSKLSQERKGINNNRFGKHLTKEQKEKISNSNKISCKERGSWGFKKNYIPWNKDKKGLTRWSADRRNKIMNFFLEYGGGMKGKNQTIEARKKISLAMSGSKAPSWKGGVTPENKLIRDGIEFRLWRKEVFARDKWTCQCCKERSGDLNAHHIQNFSDNINLRFVVNNGITLCFKDHMLFHKIYGKKDNNKSQLIKFLKEFTKKSGELLETPEKDNQQPSYLGTDKRFND
jgi:hypothetical protein